MSNQYLQLYYNNELIIENLDDFIEFKKSLIQYLNPNSTKNKCIRIFNTKTNKLKILKKINVYELKTFVMNAENEIKLMKNTNVKSITYNKIWKN
tara:strand:- start:1091 stop:1375 length:285 start_codon:yes stop_codon:yes gene_type:complete